MFHGMAETSVHVLASLLAGYATRYMGRLLALAQMGELDVWPFESLQKRGMRRKCHTLDALY